MLMKKISGIILMFLITLMLVSCNPDESVATVKFTIEDEVHLVHVVKGYKINLNFVPNTDLDTYEFIGWALDDEITDIEKLIVKTDLEFVAVYKDLLENIVLNSKNVVYNGEVQKLVVENLPSEYSVIYENNDNVNVGEHVVKAIIFKDDKVLRNRRATITITKKDLNIVLESKDVKFDGLSHVLDTFTDLPENFTTILVDNEAKVYPGIYEVSAIVNGNNNYNYQKLVKSHLKIYYEITYHKLNEEIIVKNYNTWLLDNDLDTDVEGKVFEGFYLDENFTTKLSDKFYLEGHLDIYLKYSNK